ncbi:MAG: hypothetical protein ABF289_06760 [Clostridiales bacterium]
MIIWRGLGVLVPIIFILTAILVSIIVDTILVSYINIPEVNIASLLSGVVAGFPIYKLGKIVNKETSDHSLFFINFEIWGFIFPIMGIIGFFVL